MEPLLAYRQYDLAHEFHEFYVIRRPNEVDRDPQTGGHVPFRFANQISVVYGGGATVQARKCVNRVLHPVHYSSV